MDNCKTYFDNFEINTDKALLQINVIHDFLSKEAYWSKNIPKHVVEKAIDNSICIGIYKDENQVGFARVITDEATFAYLADVFVLPAFRGKGLSKALMTFIMSWDWVAQIRRFTLATRDAHGLYAGFGFKAPAKPEINMEISKPGIYGDSNNPCR
jgi:N-acetylglutamate synthase-like GNAT family acetyltransferase